MRRSRLMPRRRLIWRHEAGEEEAGSGGESKAGRLPITSPPLLSTLVAAFTGPLLSMGLRLYLP